LKNLNGLANRRARSAPKILTASHAGAGKTLEFSMICYLGFGIHFVIPICEQGVLMRQHIGHIKALILITILMIVSSMSYAGSQSRKPSSVSVNSWKTELEIFRSKEFNSLNEMKKSATDFQNKLADDENIMYAEKVNLRNQMYKLEIQKAATFPEPKIVGFKKVPVDPTNPGRGYVLEPEFK
jgi:hypothetical protein